MTAMTVCLFVVYGLTTPCFHALWDLKLRGSLFATTAVFLLLFPVYYSIYRTFDIWTFPVLLTIHTNLAFFYEHTLKPGLQFKLRVSV